MGKPNVTDDEESDGEEGDADAEDEPPRKKLCKDEGDMVDDLLSTLEKDAAFSASDD